MRYVGPVLDDPAWTQPWSPPEGEDPLVLVAMSSTYMEQHVTLQTVVDALGTLPVRGLVTTGPALDRRAVSAPDNVTVVSSAPHNRVLEHASVAVTHGGHGTVMKCLAAGVPMVVMPHGRDQKDNGVRVVARGGPACWSSGARPALRSPQRCAGFFATAPTGRGRVVSGRQCAVRPPPTTSSVPWRSCPAPLCTSRRLSPAE